mmetsp:Transcript_21514/g.52340  ORF Transcript_21514/g.52340 Transcript_21514/m.52340 type:complete len:153 (-) Transcript_21514:107-565(-)
MRASASLALVSPHVNACSVECISEFEVCQTSFIALVVDTTTRRFRDALDALNDNLMLSAVDSLSATHGCHQMHGQWIDGCFFSSKGDCDQAIRRPLQANVFDICSWAQCEDSSECFSPPFTEKPECIDGACVLQSQPSCVAASDSRFKLSCR